MATYKVLYWQEIPTQIKAEDDANDVTVQMPGGDLRLHREANGNLVQAGPARRVYRALIELSDFDASATRAE